MRSPRTRVLCLSLLLVLLTVILSVLPVAAQDNILRIVTNADVSKLDPHLAYEFDTWPATGLFYVGLVRLAEPFEPEPGLAESWTVSDDGLTYTFVLREGLKFSDGSDLNAEDVKYSFERLLNPETASPTAYMFEAITGTEAFQNGEADEVTGIRIVDDLTVEFTLDFPVWTLMLRFALPPGFIVAREGVEAAENFSREPLGAGPFVLDEWQSGIALRGSRNPNYYLEGLPNFDGFEIAVGVEPSVGILRIENGEADVSLDFVPNADYPRLASDPVLAERMIPIAGFPNFDYVGLNTNVEPFTDVRVRQALSMAIDRDRLVLLLNNRATAANGPIPPSVGGNDDVNPPTAYDPEGARALLAEAGYPDGFTTEMLSTTDPQQVTLSQAVISDWAAIGVNAELVTMESGPFTDLVVNHPEETQAIMGEWYLDYQDPSNIYEPLHMCGGSYNFGANCFPDMDAVFEAANALPLGDERWAAFAAIEATMNEMSPKVYLDYRQNYYLLSDRLNIISDPAVLLRWDTASIE